MECIARLYTCKVQCLSSMASVDCTPSGILILSFDQRADVIDAQSAAQKMVKTQVWVPRVIVQEQVVQQNHGHILSCPCGHGLHRKHFLGTFSDGVIVFSLFTGDQTSPNTGNKNISRNMLRSLLPSRDLHQTRFNLDLGVRS